jgi:tRNA (guanine-N7-)-methyltransferase
MSLLPAVETAPTPDVPDRGTPAAIVPDQHLYQPASWFEPLVPASIFGRSNLLEVELGSGDGSFIVEWARRHPDRDFLAVERLLGRIRKVDRKAQRANLTNLKALRIEASYCLEYLLPAGTVTALHIYFPDPWPKRRHHKNRLINERFPELTWRCLAPGAPVHLRTDDANYFEQMIRVFGTDTRFEMVETPAELASVTTDFERGFNAEGILTRRATFLRR